MIKISMIASLVLISSTALAGSITGPGRSEAVVDPGETKVLRDYFEGGKVASVNVEGLGAGDLDCVVFGEDGSVADSDISPMNGCVLLWIPEKSEKFVIRITNTGSKPSVMILTTN